MAQLLSEGKDCSQTKVALEATPGYFFNPLAAERVGKVLPDAKLLLV